jgi:hypothetical protein
MWTALFGRSNDAINENPVLNVVPNETEDDSALSMVIKRINQLVIKVGEHEFEKKKLVEGVRREV